MRDIIGLIPAAGSARRLGDISQSKEILPVVFDSGRRNVPIAAKPACHYLLEGFVTAGIKKAFVVLRTGKWDIPASLTRDPVPGIELSYIALEESPGVPWTLDRAYSFVRHADVVMGFPDILIRPSAFYRQMVEKLRKGGSDVVLGVAPTVTPDKVDVVEIVGEDRVNSIQPKPTGLNTAKAWIAAAWRPSFTEYMHEFLVRFPEKGDAGRELYVGDIVAASLADLDVRAVECNEAQFVDIGTPKDLSSVTAGPTS